MSDFADSIRHARSSTKPVDAPPPHPELDSSRRHLIGLPPPGASLAELEAQRRRVADLTRKVDELNAAILDEILRHPEGLSGYPRTVAALARKASVANRRD